MTLRPRQPAMGRINQARSRMAPGGRRWSESPIPRVGNRRVRVTPAALPVAPWPSAISEGSWTTVPNAALEVTLGNSTMTCYVSVFRGIGAGPTIIGGDPPPATPAGWTVLEAGNVGDLFYQVAYLWSDSADFSATWYVGTRAQVDVYVCEPSIVSPQPTPVVALTERAAATSHPMKSPPAWFGSPWQHTAYLAPDPKGATSYSPTTPSVYLQYDVGDEGLAEPFLLDDYPSALSTATRTTANAWDSVSFAFGFTA